MITYGQVVSEIPSVGVCVVRHRRCGYALKEVCMWDAAFKKAKITVLISNNSNWPLL